MAQSDLQNKSTDRPYTQHGATCRPEPAYHEAAVETGTGSPVAVGGSPTQTTDVREALRDKGVEGLIDAVLDASHALADFNRSDIRLRAEIEQLRGQVTKLEEDVAFARRATGRLL